MHVSPKRSYFLAGLVSTSLARSILPTADDSLATGRINGSCTVRLVRRTSVCGVLSGRGSKVWWTIWLHRQCNDVYALEMRRAIPMRQRQRMTMCGGHDSNYKQCSHAKNRAITSGVNTLVRRVRRGHLRFPFPPPLPPVPPMPPPPLAPDSQLLTYLFTNQLTSDHTVVQASCAAWCDKGAHALEQHHWCKCASCKNMTRPPLEEGTPCWHVSSRCARVATPGFLSMAFWAHWLPPCSGS